jgi:hypothetical protein
VKKLFKKEYRTNYIVYLNEPYDNPHGYKGLFSSDIKEFDDLEEAKKYARDNARWRKCFITEARPILLFDNTVQEHTL